MTVEPMRIERSTRDGVTVVVPDGVLDLASYARLRDTLIKCAMEVPRGIVVDLDELEVPTAATLAVFPTVWMRISDWPGVPMLLVASDPDDRDVLAQNGIDRYLPTHPSVGAALHALDEPNSRHRSATDLPELGTAALDARRFVTERCQRWGCGIQLVQDAVVVVNALVDNAVRYAAGEPSLRLELRRGILTIAVYDDGPMFIRPGPAEEAPVRIGLGLTLVEGLASAWGCAETSTGRKVVWAALHPLDHTV